MLARHVLKGGSTGFDFRVYGIGPGAIVEQDVRAAHGVTGRMRSKFVPQLVFGNLNLQADLLAYVGFDHGLVPS